MDDTIAEPFEGAAPSRREGEKSAGHAASSGEVSPATLANKLGQETGTSPTSNGSSTVSSESEREIVRATCRLAVIPSAEERPLMWAASRSAALVRNAILRALWTDDAARFDAFVAENKGVLPRSKQWPIPTLNAYQIGRAICPTLNPGIVATLSREVQRKWAQSRWEALVRQTLSPPHYRDNAPLPLRRQEVRFERKERTNDKGKREEYFVLRAVLGAGGEGRIELEVVPRDGWQHVVLGNIASGAWKLGAPMLEHDRRGKWFLRLPYKRVVDATPADERVVAINRGIVTFLAAIGHDGKEWLYDGHDIEAYLKQTKRRRIEYQRSLKASNRGGRGRKRALRPIEHLAGKADRWRRTKSQTVARRFALWVKSQKYTKVLIEDFKGIRDSPPEGLAGGQATWERIQSWPYYDLGSRIRSCLEELGITVEETDPTCNSMRCPKCGTVDPALRNLKKRVLVCPCGFKRHLDIAFGMNAMDKWRGVWLPPKETQDKVDKNRARRARRAPRKKK
jgi:transposase